MDGDSHAEREQYDASRTKRIERDGLLIIRFLNPDVSTHLDAVLEDILHECQTRTQYPNHPNPLPEGEGIRTDMSRR